MDQHMLRVSNPSTPPGQISQPAAVTPVKPMAAPPPDQVSCETPPRVEMPKEISKVKFQRVGDGRRVPSFVPQDAPTSLELKAPGTIPKFLELPVPDLGEVVEDARLKAPELPTHGSKKVEENSLEDFVLSDEDDPERVRAGEVGKKRPYNRTKKRLKSERETQLRILGNWLAEKGLDYLEFHAQHRASSVIKKAAVCKDGGFVSFKHRLLTEEQPTCECCQGLLMHFGMTREDIKRVLASDPGDKPVEEDVGKGKSDQADNLQEEGDEYAACVAYIKSYSDVVELVEGCKLAYRCKICKSKTQPAGKLNKLGRSKLNSVKFFLHQHLDCPTHKKNMLKHQKQQQPGREVGDEGDRECHGYVVGEPNSQGGLYVYQHEFHLWATHTSSSMLKHEYTLALHEGSWTLKHRNCTGVVKGSTVSCPYCLSLGSPKGVQRQVLRFATKYYAAKLLHHRLFFSDEQADAFEKSVSESVYGHRSSLWMEIVKLTNPQLQQFVRKSFKTIIDEQKNPAMLTFMDSKVDPCMKVHVSAIDCKMKRLFSQFCDAVDGNSLTVSWLHASLECKESMNKEKK